MHIDKARKLAVGDLVICPPDRGDAGFAGKITRVDTSQKSSRNIDGHEYIGVTVQGPHGKAVWPSNRLSLTGQVMWRR